MNQSLDSNLVIRSLYWMDLNLYSEKQLDDSQEKEEFSRLEKVLQKDLLDGLKSGDGYHAVVQWSKSKRIPTLYNVRVSLIYSLLSEVDRTNPEGRPHSGIGPAETTGIINPPPPPPPPPRHEWQVYFQDSALKPFELVLEPIRTSAIESRVPQLQAFKQ